MSKLIYIKDDLVVQIPQARVEYYSLSNVRFVHAAVPAALQLQLCNFVWNRSISLSIRGFARNCGGSVRNSREGGFAVIHLVLKVTELVAAIFRFDAAA